MSWSFYKSVRGQGRLCGEGLLEESLSNKQRFARQIKGERAAQAKKIT